MSPRGFITAMHHCDRLYVSTTASCNVQLVILYLYARGLIIHGIFNARRDGERERDKVGFLLLPRRWKIAGFNTFPIAKLIYINIQSREWCIYQASIERSEKLRVIRNSISMSHEVYTYTYCSLHHVGTVVVIGFPRRSRASIVETRSLQTHTYIA